MMKEIVARERRTSSTIPMYVCGGHAGGDEEEIYYIKKIFYVVLFGNQAHATQTIVVLDQF